MKQPKLFQFSKLTNIKENKRDLLDTFNFKTINDAKKTERFKNLKADEIYSVLFTDYNNDIDKLNANAKKTYEKKIKKKQVIKQAIKSKTLNYSVHITANVKVTYKNFGHQSYIQPIDEYQEFQAKNITNLKEKVKAFTNKSYNTETEYEIQELIENSLDYQIVDTKPLVNIMDVPMRRAQVATLSFLKYVDKINDISYKNHNDKCVIEILKNHLNIKKENTITKHFEEGSLKIYGEPFDINSGVSSRLLLYLCQKMNISLLGLDQNDNKFVKYTKTNDGTRAYKSIIFYMVLGHFYLINDKDAVNSISHAFQEGHKVSTSLLNNEEGQTNEKDYVYADNIFNYSTQCHNERNFQEEFEKLEMLPEPTNTIIIYENFNLMNELRAYIEMYNDVPKNIKFDKISVVKQFKTQYGLTLSINNSKHINTSTTNEICDKLNLKFNNQSIGILINQVLQNFYKSKREVIASSVKNEIINKQNNSCNICKEMLNDYEIDHIRPLSNGGSNDIKNLQALCVECHKNKTLNEKANCEHFNIKDYESTFNIEAYNTINSKFFNKVQFTNYLVQDDIIDKIKENYFSPDRLKNPVNKIYSNDINKCRRNLLLHAGYDFPVYSCLDNIEIFDGSITCGNYYVECNNVFPLRKNQFYSQPIIEYCLKEGIITHKNIKYQYKPSFKLKCDYFHSLVSYIDELVDGLNEDEFIKKHTKKIMINSIIGLFGRRKNESIEFKICDNLNLKDFDYVYTNYKKPYINKMNDDYTIITNKNQINKLEGSYPIYAQILDCEAVELHKLVKKIEKIGGRAVCTKTDAVVYISPKPLEIENEFWDNANTIPKYKFEEPTLLKNVVDYCIQDKFHLQTKDYDIIKDTNEMDFNIIVARQIIESNKGCFLNGLAGRGKTALVNEIIKLINDDENIRKLTPTNVSALLINGITINKFAYTYLNNSKSITKLKHIKYIFIDEVSMMRELFYSVFLTIKFYYPDIKFIISGDFHQLEPVGDRSNFNYEKSRALYELVDRQMVHLTLCRRSDDRIPNLCDKIIGNYKYDLRPLINKQFDSYKNICFTNKTRIRINNDCMSKFLENYKGNIFEVKELSYDKNTQPYTLAEGMPLISRVNNNKLKICNNETFLCKKIETDFITVNNEMKEELKIPVEVFHKLFLLQFCITTHKSQGLSLNSKYCIHEVNKFDNKLLYVALSRATEYDNVNIVMDNNELLDYCKKLYHKGYL